MTAAVAPTTPNLASSAIRSAKRWYAPPIRLAIRDGPLSPAAMAANGDRPNRYPSMTPELSGYPQISPLRRDFAEAVTGRNDNEATERPPAGASIRSIP